MTRCLSAVAELLVCPSHHPQREIKASIKAPSDSPRGRGHLTTLDGAATVITERLSHGGVVCCKLILFIYLFVQL